MARINPRSLLRLYPRAWRDRYGDEFVALLEQEGMRPRVVGNVIAGAFDAWVSPKSHADLAAGGHGSTLRFWLVTPRTDERSLRERLPQIMATLAVGLPILGLAAAAESLAGPSRSIDVLRHASAPMAVAVVTTTYTYEEFTLRTKLAAMTAGMLVTYGVIAFWMWLWP